MIRQSTVFLILWLTIGMVAGAQAQTAPTARQDLENTVQILERQVALQQDRVHTVEQKLKTTDDQIEHRLARVIEYLTTVTDGTDSRRKVTTAKQEVFNGLMRSINFYGRERGQRFGALRQPASQATKEALAADVLRLNSRIEKRVEQALALVTSLPTEKGVPKYIDYYDNDDWQRRLNPDYSHEHRVMTQGGQWRDVASSELKASIDRLKRGRVQLDQALAAAKTDEGRKFVQGLIQHDEELITKRREQIQAALGNSNPAAKPLGNKAADALTEQIQEAKKDNTKDNAEWIRLKNERDGERTRLLALQDRLAYCQQQLGK
jgi:hypothetical protein